MNTTCLSKTIIPARSNVRFLILTNMNVFSKDELLSTYSSKDHFKIVGLPLKAITDGYGNCEIEDNEASTLTLEMLKQQCINFDIVEDLMEENPRIKLWESIQQNIYDDKLISRGHIKKGFFQIAYIDEDVFQMCLKQDDLSWLGKDFKSSSESFKEKSTDIIESLKVLSEKDTLRLEKMVESYSKKDISEEELHKLKIFLEKQLKETHLEIRLEDLSHVFNSYFLSHRALSSATVVGLNEYIFECYYVLSVLDNNGHYLLPSKIIDECTTQASLTKLLLKEQIRESKKEDSGDLIPEINYEYSMELPLLEKELIEAYGSKFTSQLIENLKIGDIIDLSGDSELSEVLSDCTPSYINFIKIESGEY